MKFITSELEDGDVLCDNLDSITPDTQIIRATYTENGHAIVFLDVSDFDATLEPDTETLRMIFDLLAFRPQCH